MRYKNVTFFTPPDGRTLNKKNAPSPGRSHSLMDNVGRAGESFLTAKL